MPKTMSIPLIIKHAGKSYDLTVDPASDNGLKMKEGIYHLTGVPLDRMKVMVKGGMLKDDADLSKLAFKPKQAIMVIGTAGPLPEKPKESVVFLEDMDDGELALATRTPAGLVNLGNTCYFAASAQALRSIPSLNLALTTFTPSSSSSSGGSPQLTNALKLLFSGMSSTTEGYAPHHFLSALRAVAPQFAEMGRGGGYAQQDADECWTTMANALQAVPGSSGKSWVDECMMGTMVKELTCDEAPEEAHTFLTESVPKLDCNISISTNHLHQGILDSLDQKIEKHSATLGRTAVYSQKSRLERLPEVLIVHEVRFYWRRDTNSKAKIMRRVKFPFEYDVLDLCTDALKAKLTPVNTALKTIAKDREERSRIRKRLVKGSKTPLAAAVEGVEGMTTTAEVYTGTSEEEQAKLTEERVRLAGLVDEGLKIDEGSNKSGLYELSAIVTHKGASADSGHYIAWVKKQPSSSSSAHPVEPQSEQDEEWHKFDDDKVSVVGRDKITTLEGGGEDSAAYILVYRSKPLE